MNKKLRKTEKIKKFVVILSEQSFIFESKNILLA